MACWPWFEEEEGGDGHACFRRVDKGRDAAAILWIDGL